jgi:hypothetical protein
MLTGGSWVVILALSRPKPDFDDHSIAGSLGTLKALDGRSDLLRVCIDLRFGSLPDYTFYPFAPSIANLHSSLLGRSHVDCLILSGIVVIDRECIRKVLADSMRLNPRIGCVLSLSVP